MSTVRRRLIVADDHLHVAHSLRSLLEPEYEVVDVVGDGAQVLTAVSRDRPDAILLDLWLPGRNGLDVLSDLATLHPKVLVIILTMHADIVVAVEAMNRGAKAYLLKDSGYEEIGEALKQVFEGKTYLSPRVTAEPAATIFRDRGA